MLSTFLAYRVYAQDIARSLAQTQARADVSRDAKYYQDNIGKVASVDAFLKNHRLFAFAMKAHGLEDMTYAKAFMRKVLEEGVDKKDSFANSLSDRRYREFAEAFNFQRHGAATTAFGRTQQGTVDKFYRQTLEEDAGAEDEGVRLALYFTRKAPTVDSILGLLADPALLKVTQTMLGISEATGALDIDKQSAMFEKRLDVKDLKDPEKLQKLITRFTSMWEMQKGQSAISGASILIGGPIALGLSGDLLASIQNFRLGGR